MNRNTLSRDDTRMASEMCEGRMLPGAAAVLWPAGPQEAAQRMVVAGGHQVVLDLDVFFFGLFFCALPSLAVFGTASLRQAQWICT